MNLKIFNNPKFGKIRTVLQESEPLFIASDVCRALEISNPSDALSRLDEDEYTLVSIEGISKGSLVNAVTEPGLYSLVLGSRKKEAKEFKRWIVHEVLPSIRKTGVFAINSKHQVQATSAGEVARLIASVDRPMRAQKSPGWKRALQAETMLNHFGLPTIEGFVEDVPLQLEIWSVMRISSLSTQQDGGE